MSRPRLLSLRVLFFTALAATLVFSSSALAGQSLMSELPTGHNTVIVVDLTELRDSPLYKQGVQMVKSHPGAAAGLQQVEQEWGVNLEEDISALVIASDSPPINAQMLSDPAAMLENPGSQQTEGALVLIRGNFDAPALLAKIADVDDDADPPSYFREDGVEVRALDGRTLAVAGGQDSYLDRMRQSLQGDRSGPGSVFDGGIRSLGASQGIYMMVQPSIADPDAMRDEVGATLSFGGIAIDLTDSEIRFGGLARLGSEEEATSTVEQVDEVRKELAGNPLLSVFGVRPLVDNLSVRQDDGDVIVRTSMTNRQASRLISRIQSMAQTQQGLQNPLQ